MKPLAITCDLYGTLLDVETNEEDLQAWTKFSFWLRLVGIWRDAEGLREAYKDWFSRLEEAMKKDGNQWPEPDVRDVLALTIGLDRKANEALIQESAYVLRSLTTERLSVREGVSDALLSLPYPKALVSNAQAAFSYAEMRSAGLASLFKFYVFSSDLGARKPDALLFRVALHRFGLEGQESMTVHVGDSYETDVVGAKAAGMKAVLVVPRGTIQLPSEGPRPDAVISPWDPKKLASTIEGLRDQFRHSFLEGCYLGRVSLLPSRRTFNVGFKKKDRFFGFV